MRAAWQKRVKIRALRYLELISGAAPLCVPGDPSTPGEPTAVLPEAARSAEAALLGLRF
jgi:hypothetical protein